jgi:two-component system chemotaxis response regulator CheB
MPDAFTGALAGRLNARSPLNIGVGMAGTVLAPGDVWFAPGGSHIRVATRGDELILLPERSAPRNSCCPAADVLFESAARTVGAGVVGVVLTGMGRDGADGAAAVIAAGGRVIAQDQDTSTVWGMPGAVTQEGHATAVLPLDDIATRLSMWARKRVAS